MPPFTDKAHELLKLQNKYNQVILVLGQKLPKR
jgi:hypothetical protein